MSAPFAPAWDAPREARHLLLRMNDDELAENRLSLHRTLEGAKAAAEKDWRERGYGEGGEGDNAALHLGWVVEDDGWAAAWDTAAYLEIGETREYRVEAWPVED
jgi:hypothetical protein